MENKTSKYFKYAIGEIILVVIGILIALQINNWNEQRKNEAIGLQLLKQVQTDLLRNIERSDELIEYYRIKDSLTYRVMNNQVTVEDYKTNITFSRLIMSANEFEIEDNAFNALVERTDILPEYFRPLIDDLKILYSKKQGIDISNERSLSFLTKIKSFLSNNFDSYSEFQYNKFSETPEELIDYFLNNPKYKNKVSEYANLSIRNLLEETKNFRVLSIENFLNINKFLKTDLSKFTDSVTFLYKIDKYQSAIGTYTINFNNVNESLSIRIEDDKMFFEVGVGEKIIKIPLYPLNETRFMIAEDPSFYRFKKDNSDNISGIEIRLDNDIIEWHKNK